MTYCTLAFANLKGGTGKTTSAAYVSHHLASMGLSILMVDADPQGSLLRWSERASWSIPTIALPVRNLDTRLAGIVPSKIDLVVIDTPPADDYRGIVGAALRGADVVVVPMAPTLLEFERLREVWSAIEAESEQRRTGAKDAVLLNRTVTNARSTKVYRQIIAGEGRVVLEAEVARREAVAQSFGSDVVLGSAFRGAAEEIAAMMELA